MQTDILHGPILLAPDNFTSIERTPWAGENIAKLFKEAAVPQSRGAKIGESWEFSCDPAMPSKLADGETTLLDFVDAHRDAVLSAARAHEGCQILLKLLNANEPLSLQVHPDDQHPALKTAECGKPETWLILHVELGAGLYLGFSQRISRKELRIAIENGQDIKPLLNFVPVKAGDFFEIEPGMPHAIGPGVTLLEPQRVLLGKSGKTYRLWDWGRKREMHLVEGLPIIDPENQVGEAFAKRMRRRGETKTVGGLQWTQYPSNPFYQVHVFAGTSAAPLNLKIANGYGALVMLAGSMQMAGKNKRKIALAKGISALLPHSAENFILDGVANAHFAVVIPVGAVLTLDG